MVPDAHRPASLPRGLTSAGYLVPSHAAPIPRECFTVNTVWRAEPGPAEGTTQLGVHLRVGRRRWWW